MDNVDGPQSRRERRAAAGKNPTDATNVPMIKPDYNAKPSHKTLYDIVEERTAALIAKEKVDAEGDGLGYGDYAFMSDEQLGAFANAIIYCLSLSMLHITLDVLVLSQYRQDIIWSDIAGRIARMTPALFTLVWISHTEQVRRWRLTRQISFLVLSIVAGCYLIYSGNEFGYYLVMKRAPPTGTLWVWSVVEMDLIWSFVHVSAIGGYMLYTGYRPF